MKWINWLEGDPSSSNWTTTDTRCPSMSRKELNGKSRVSSLGIRSRGYRMMRRMYWLWRRPSQKYRRLLLTRILPSMMRRVTICSWRGNFSYFMVKSLAIREKRKSWFHLMMKWEATISYHRRSRWTRSSRITGIVDLLPKPKELCRSNNRQKRLRTSLIHLQISKLLWQINWSQRNLRMLNLNQPSKSHQAEWSLERNPCILPWKLVPLCRAPVA